MSASWSSQQIVIFEWFVNGTRHAIVRARAGCGKTTVIIEGVKRAPKVPTLICAFSKIIQEELNTRIGTDFPHVIAKTLHSVGYGCVRQFRDRIRVSFDSTRADKLTETVCGITPPDAIKKLVSKLHTKGREIAPHASKLGDLTAIAITFECEPAEEWTNRYPLEYVETKALEAMALAADVKSGETIDGSDMIFLPVRNGWLTKQYDLVVVDEAQDMTTAQLEIATGVLNTGGRICVVGDDKQAIFGFRGADSGSLDRLKNELDAVEFGLTTTYRCGNAIVCLAQEFVPDFLAGPTNPQGIISELAQSKIAATAGPGDFVLSRVNAPLVSIAMQLLRSGKRARVAGRDIGRGLTTLIRKFRANSVPGLLSQIEAWGAKESRRLEAQLKTATNGRKAAITAKLEAVHDQADMLVSLTEGAKNVAEVVTRIEALFTDDGLGAAGIVTCSSVHRSKGLEANRVFVLRDTLRQNNDEEKNITYVAITRAKNELVWVVKDAA